MKVWLTALAITFCLAAVLLFAVDAAPGAAADLFVVDDDGGPWADFETIQDAVDAASSGDQIRVYAGTYNESVTIDEGVALTGNGTDATFVNGGDTAFDVVWAKVFIEGMNVSADVYCFRVCNTTQVVIGNNSMWGRASMGMAGFGVYVRYSSEVMVWDDTIFGVNTSIYLKKAIDSRVLNNDIEANSQGIVASACAPAVRGNTLAGMAYGIYLLSTDGAAVARNTVRAWYWGIRVWFSTGDLVRANHVYDAWYGIHVGRSTNIEIVDNVMHGTGIYLDGTSLPEFDSHTIKYNYVNGKDVVYAVGESSTTFDSGVGQLLLVDCDDIVVDGLNVSRTTAGVLAAYVDGLTVLDHRASSCYYGIYLERTTGVAVADAVMWGNTYGVYIRHADGVSVDNLEGEGNVRGISSFFDLSLPSTNITLTDLDLRGGDYGVEIDHAENVLLGGVLIEGASQAGARLESVSNATVDKFHVTGGRYAIWTSTALSIGSDDITIANGVAEGQQTAGVYLHDTGNATVEGCTIEGAFRGIRVLEGRDTVLADNGIVDCNGSIEIEGSENVTLWGNVMTGGGGVHLVPGYIPAMASHAIPENNTLDGRPVLYAVGWYDVVEDGDWSQVMLLSSSNVTLRGLRLVRACSPVLMVDCDACVLEECKIRRAGLCGVTLSSSENCTVRGNRIALSYGAAISMDKGCAWNAVHGNHLVRNCERPWPTPQAEDYGVDNVWDDGAAGNLWSDYNGTDADMDGIGDTPYDITSTYAARDRFPIMDAAPSLLAPSVDPAVGKVSTTFNFTVTYADLYGDPDPSVWLFVDGTGYAAIPAIDGNWSSGWTFYREMGLATGDHTFNFTAFDGRMWNSTRSITGPHVNSPPALGDAGVLPANGSSSQAFMFWAEYRDADNESASPALVHIDGVPYVMTLFGDGGSADFTANVTYIYNTVLAPGDHVFNFTASDGMEWASTANFTGPYANHPPVIAGWMVTPSFGNESTVFNFSLSFKDVESENATMARLYVDSVPYDIPYGGWCPCTNGTRYTLNISLPPGLLTFNMTVSDGWEWTSITNQTLKVDRPPLLADGAAHPAEANESVPFTFNVTYIDADGDPPAWVLVHIGNSSFAMSQAEPSDDDFTDGALFTYRTMLDPGNHTFAFSASDGWMDAWLDGGLVSVNESDVPVKPIAYIDIIDPLTVRSDGTVHLQGRGSGGTMVAYEWTSDIDGLIGNGSMIDVGGLTPGTHNVSFRVLNEDDLWSDPVNGTFRVNSPPAIPFWKATPEWGNASTLFNFSAAYEDAESQNATAFFVYIDGEPRVMVWGGRCPCKHSLSRFENFTTLPPGNHTFNYTATDGLEWATTGTFHVKVNSAPALGDGSVAPGAGNENTEFKFRVIYSDPDNDPPWRVQVVIDGTPFRMAKGNDSDLDYTDGAVFRFITLLDVGNHTFSFVASDWYETAALEGGVIEVVEGEGPITPMAHIERIHPTVVGPGDAVRFEGWGVGGEITDHEWRSDLDGLLGGEAEIVRSDLSVGVHNISFRVRNDDGLWSGPEYGSLTVQSTVPVPDAAVISVTIVGSDHVRGDTVSIVVSAMNQGDASAEFVVVVYVHDANTTYSSPADLQSIGSFNVSLGVDGTESLSLVWIAVPGEHEVVAWADPANVLIELRENNNVGTARISVSEAPAPGPEEKGEEVDVVLVAGMVVMIALIAIAIFTLIRRPRRPAPADMRPQGNGVPPYGIGEGEDSAFSTAPPHRNENASPDGVERPEEDRTGGGSAEGFPLPGPSSRAQGGTEVDGTVAEGPGKEGPRDEAYEAAAASVGNVR